MIALWTFEVWLNATREDLVRWIMQERERSVEDWKTSHCDRIEAKKVKERSERNEIFATSPSVAIITDLRREQAQRIINGDADELRRREIVTVASRGE